MANVLFFVAPCLTFVSFLFALIAIVLPEWSVEIDATANGTLKATYGVWGSCWKNTNANGEESSDCNYFFGGRHW